MVYWIFLGVAPIATVTGMAAASEVYHKTCVLAELIGSNCMLVTDEDGEVIAEYKEED